MLRQIRRGPYDKGARGHRRIRPHHRQGGMRPDRERRLLRRGPGRQGRKRQPALRHIHPSGSLLREERRPRSREEPGAGAQAPGGRGPGGLSQRGQIHVPFHGHQREAQDRGLPFHHALPEPGHSQVQGRSGVHPGGYPGPHRGGEPGGGPGS